MKQGNSHYLHHLRHQEPQRVSLHLILVDQEVSVLTDLFCNSRGTDKPEVRLTAEVTQKHSKHSQQRVFYNRVIKTSDEYFQ